MKTPKPTLQMGLGVFVMVSLWDDLDAENIRDGNTLPIRHLNHAVDRVDSFDFMSIMPELLSTLYFYLQTI